jgi:SAM-dependent methyltransferase
MSSMKGGSVYICNVNKLCITAQRRCIRVHSIFITEPSRKAKNIFTGMTNQKKRFADHQRSTTTLEASEFNPRSKIEQPNNCLHPIYIFPLKANAKMVLEFSKNIDQARVFFINSNSNILERFKSLIDDEEKEFVFDDRSNSQNDNEPFLTLLNVSIKNIQKDKAKRCKLKVNGSACQMLVLSNNCSKPKSLLGPLRKQLGEIIESNSIQHILQFLNVQGPKKEVENVSKSHIKRKSENQQLGEKSKQSKVEKEIAPATYFTQEAIADELYKRIKAKIKKFDGIDLEKEFEDFEFLVLLPNRCSLEDQTVMRIQEKFIRKKNPGKHVTRICPNSTDLQNKWNCFIERTRENPKKFFLVIHDECHWAAGTIFTSKFLGFDQGDYQYLNGQLLPNLFTLMVSATPYNFFTSPHLEPADILYWNRHLVKKQLENTYQGLTHFRKGTENCKMLSTASNMSKWWENCQEYFCPMIQNGFTREFILVLLDYCTAISGCANQDQAIKQGLNFPVTPEVKNCVQQCIHQNKQIIVRLEAAFDEVRPTEVANIVLQEVIDTFQQKVDVMVLTSTEQKNPIKDAVLDDTSKIIIVIDQYKMGDTFPKTCICFDLRARYLFPIHDFTSIIQDVGRAFGYGKRPLLLLSQQADEFLTDIWDPNTGYISWESLKRKLTNVVLGKNTTRINVSLQQKPFEEKIPNEVDTTEMVIQQFQEIYEHDPIEPVFLFRLKLTGDCKAFKHRIFLKAEPQNGKTGAFLHLAHLLEEKLCKDPFFLREFTTKSYSKKSLDKIEQEFNTKEGREEHKKYLRVLGRAREKRKEVGIVEPSKWAALCLIKNLLENFQQNKAEIQIADFGCGDMQFGNFFNDEIKRNPQLAQKKFTIHAVDISPNEVPISKQLRKSKQIKIKTHPGISCGSSTAFPSEYFDYIVSTLALFGNEDSWKETIQTAFFALKTNGLFILAEWDKYLPSKTAQKLLSAGIICNHFAPGIFHLKKKT